MRKIKPGTIIPTDEEDAAITAGALADPDNPPLADDEIDRLKPLRGRPKLLKPKEVINIRLDADVLAAIKASGPGWQTRINLMLRDALKRRP